MSKRVSRCSVPQCAEPSFRSLRCEAHYASLRRAVETPQPAREPAPRGAASPAWKGDAIGYTAMHARVAAMRGLASALACVECQAPAVHWSYDHLDPTERISRQGWPFSTKVEHYQPRCASCHSALDKSAHREAS